MPTDASVAPILALSWSSSHLLLQVLLVDVANIEDITIAWHVLTKFSLLPMCASSSQLPAIYYSAAFPFTPT